MIYFIFILSLVSTIYFCSIIWVILGFIKIKKVGNRHLSLNVEKNISVIIPVRNEASNIINCLKSIEIQSFNNDKFEVIIINDNSTDNTKEIIDNYIKGSILNIRLYSLSNKTSKKEALKFGIEKSTFEIIATTDADCIVPKKWLKCISSKVLEDAEMLLGPIDFKEKSGILAGFQSLDMFALQGVEFGALAHLKPILNNAANLSYSKKSFIDVDGFDEYKTPSGDDVFLLERYKEKGKKIIGLLSKDFIVETESENNFSNFFNQRLRWSSKSKYYSNKLLIYFSSIILLQNLSLLFIYFGLPLVEKYRIHLIILLFSKWLIDFILLFLVADFFERRRSLFYFLPVQFLYPIYIVVIWIASMTMKFEWKGRKFNG
ncbi:glycosyltransferase [Vicingaceae bacterium]|nr:glycosyltransferase [Vicingaceae bacterium]